MQLFIGFKALSEKCLCLEFFCSDFLIFGLNREIYSVNLRIQSKCGEMWTKSSEHGQYLPNEELLCENQNAKKKRFRGNKQNSFLHKFAVRFMWSRNVFRRLMLYSDHDTAIFYMSTWFWYEKHIPLIFLNT